MFLQKTVKAFSIVAIVLSSLGILLSILGALYLQVGIGKLTFFMGIASWGILLWASLIGLKLCSPSYKLYEEEYKKVGIRIYLIIVAFLLFFFVGVVLGLVLSVILLAALWGLKRNFTRYPGLYAPGYVLSPSGLGKPVCGE